MIYIRTKAVAGTNVNAGFTRFFLFRPTSKSNGTTPKEAVSTLNTDDERCSSHPAITAHNSFYQVLESQEGIFTAHTVTQQQLFSQKPPWKGRPERMRVLF